MRGDALFGRYWAADSVIHRLDPRTKLLGTIALTVTIFCAGNFWALGLLVIAIVALFALARIPFLQALKSIAPLSFIIVITMLFNLFFVQGGETYVNWGWLAISAEGVRMTVFIGVRLTLLLLIGSLLTLTTTTLDITEAFERLGEPLRKLGAPAHEFALIMGITLRFLPQFVDEFQTIRAAQLARGAKLASNPTKGGLAGLTSLLVPLFASAFRHADTLSAAMEARCYHGADGRTRLNPLAFATRDAIATVTLAVVFAATLVLTFAL